MTARKNSAAFDRCLKAVSKRRGVRSPGGVCAASERRRGLMNPASYRGKSVAELEQYRVYAMARAYDNDWMVRDQGRRDVEAIDKALMSARRREAKKGNPLPLAAAQALEGSALAPYQKKAAKEADGLRKKLGLKLNRAKRRSNPKNPAGGASRAYEEFHGRASDQWIEITTRMHEHTYLFAIGELVKIDIIAQNGYRVALTGFETKNGNLAFLCGNEKGKTNPQMFIEGGDQRVDLAQFGIHEPIHEMEVLGEADNVEYYTVKDHLGDEGGEAIYRHKLKKVRIRKKPTVIYDTRNHLLSFAGGNYTIEPEGITN